MNKLFGYARLAAAPLVLALALPLGAQDQGITKQQADQIINELRQIRQLLEKQQANPGQKKPDEPVRTTMNLQGLPMLGSKDAPLTIVEFTDYQCPFCQRFHNTSYADIKKNYIDTGKVRFFSRDMPLDMHADAMRAAQAARCANDQGQFWPMREIMSANPDKLNLEALVGDAAGLKMDANAFRTCVTSDKYKEAVESDVMEAMRIGATGTPSFIVGKTTPDGVDGELVVGALPYSMFDAKLKQLGAK